LTQHTDKVLSLRSSLKRNEIYSGSGDRALCRWNSTTQELIDVDKSHTGAVAAIVLVTVPEDGSIELWSGSHERSLVIHRFS
jgi:WD40 repeat protein